MTFAGLVSSASIVGGLGDDSILLSNTGFTGFNLAVANNVYYWEGGSDTIGFTASVTSGTVGTVFTAKVLDGQFTTVATQAGAGGVQVIGTTGSSTTVLATFLGVTNTSAIVATTASASEFASVTAIG